MDRVTVRDLRNSGGEVLGRVEHGEPLVVTRDGRPVAELRPLRPRGLDAQTLLARWRNLPQVDPAALQRDVDAIIDQRLW